MDMNGDSGDLVSLPRPVAPAHLPSSGSPQRYFNSFKTPRLPYLAVLRSCN